MADEVDPSLARVLWGISEATAPRSLSQLAVSYWLQVLMLTGIVMVFGGWLFGQPAVTRAGWVTLGGAIAVQSPALRDRGRARAAGALAALAGRAWARTVATVGRAARKIVPQRLRRRVTASRTFVILGALAVVLIALAVLELLRHLGDDAHAFWDWLTGRF